MDLQFNIETIIENSTKWSNDVYKNNLLNKIQLYFNETEQKIFVAYLYSYIDECDYTHTIDFNNIWRWLGFRHKSRALSLLSDKFIYDLDFHVYQEEGQEEIIMLNLETFKYFSLYASKKKSIDVRIFFINVEEIVCEYLQEKYRQLKNNINNSTIHNKEPVNKKQETPTNNTFIKNLDDLLPILHTKKHALIRNLNKNYKENKHYIVKNHIKTNHTNGHGGHNKINYLLTEKTYELFKNSYNLRNKYIVQMSDNITYVNAITMCIENQTIGFIENSLKGKTEMRRQFMFGKYKVDLYFPSYHLIVECDEYGHKDRNPQYEEEREKYLISLGNTMIRYNPNEENFDISNVLQKIHKII